LGVKHADERLTGRKKKGRKKTYVKNISLQSYGVSEEQPPPTGCDLTTPPSGEDGVRHYPTTPQMQEHPFFILFLFFQ